MVVHSRLVCHEVVMDHEWNRKRATGHQSLNLDNAKLTMEPELQNISFYHHLGGRIGFNTVAVLHQNSGVIGKSTPSALEISQNIHCFDYQAQIHSKIWSRPCYIRKPDCRFIDESSFQLEKKPNAIFCPFAHIAIGKCSFLPKHDSQGCEWVC